MPALIGERCRPMPPPPEAAPVVSRHLFHLFFQVEIRHRRPPWRHPIAGAEGAESATRLWQFYHRSFGTTASARASPALRTYPSQRQTLSGRLDAESPVAQKGANLLNYCAKPPVGERENSLDRIHRPSLARRSKATRFSSRPGNAFSGTMVGPSA